LALTQRNPTASSAASRANDLRVAQRSSVYLFFHDPPRSTISVDFPLDRAEPSVGAPS
jgi:hypothetical protein